jgi:methionine synthase II (cobalamin-independent)
VEEAGKGVLAKQLAAGIDIGHDGEEPRSGFASYVTQRMTGFGGVGTRPPWRDFVDFPDFAALWQQRMAHQTIAAAFTTPQAVAEIDYTDLSAAEQECDLFVRCSQSQPQQFTERFMTAVSPGRVATYFLNAYYDSHENYVWAVARQLKKKYELIHAKGLLLSIDAPDLAADRGGYFQHVSLQEFQKVAANVAAINWATQSMPAERIRLHVCWANLESPHIHDVPLAQIPPILYQALAQKQFEDYRLGEEFESYARTVTETDIVNFTCFAGLKLPMFIDEEFSKKHSLYGTRVAPGLMTASLAAGMLEDILGKYTLAALGLDRFKFTPYLSRSLPGRSKGIGSETRAQSGRNRRELS